jgi:putative hydrolase of the HAD superfamily
LTVEVVLFDLGGVLIELSGEEVFAQWMGGVSRDELWRRWLTSPAVREFETGRRSAAAFAQGVVDEFALAVTPDEFLAAFAAWPRGFFDGASSLLRETRGRTRVGCLSNSNALHWERFRRELDIESHFDVSFASHRLGALKPDREVFEHVVTELRCPADTVLLLDDNALNVDGARAAGLRAELVRGVDAARAALSRHSL